MLLIYHSNIAYYRYIDVRKLLNCFQLLAEIFLDFLMGRDDYLRALRTLLREIIRAVKHDMNFNAFTMALMRDNIDSKFRELDAMLKVTLFLYTAVKNQPCFDILVSRMDHILNTLSRLNYVLIY